MLDLFTKEAVKSGASGGFTELKKYLYRVASSPIRNVSMSSYTINVFFQSNKANITQDLTLRTVYMHLTLKRYK